MKNENPIIPEFIKLGLIKKKNFEFVGYTNRGKKVKVYRDKITNLFFLEKYLISDRYYTNDRTMNKNQIKKYLKMLAFDDKRRSDQFKKYLLNKSILDFGCEFGGFLKFVKNAKKKFGVELNKNCINYLKKNSNDTIVSNSIKNIDEKFDVITLFHVLEHLPHQKDTLIELKKKLNKKGKIILEVPSANDILLSIKNLYSFKNFTFWHEHLILHTAQSLKKILSKAGFNRIKIIHFQRYDLSNHLGWFLKNKPGGHNYFKNLIDKKSKLNYENYLVKNHTTDTLIAIASN